MKRVLITGATGMIGGLVLKESLSSPDVKEVISLVRRPSGISKKNLKEVIIPDFKNYAQFEDLFKAIDTVYFCIGVYTGQVSKEKFKEITVDYITSFVDTLKKHSPKATFCFLSGAGADRTERSRMAFAKYKGMAENYLLKELEHVQIFRPGYIYPVHKRKEPNITYEISRALYPLIRLMGKNTSIKSTELASAIFQSGDASGKRTLENRDIVNFINP
ncbi:NAD(P)H-binding protein [Xanthovirga aplysinae]|uniref:NAD(P)H-binding protein n=1 Tax=Xanthovirga aplysinae TaxID=2529853 RepID=UPI0012BC4D93|nr:NAD(P)H-binding protein [Xanthovirga aplysinae]MTI31547.1 NAD-dependent epimerase/dehydratase family protein [Xanthovirga aplysinae]